MPCGILRSATQTGLNSISQKGKYYKLINVYAKKSIDMFDEERV